MTATKWTMADAAWQNKVADKNLKLYGAGAEAQPARLHLFQPGRIAHQHDTTDSEAARRLLAWGVEAHRAKEAAELSRPYNFEPSPEWPRRMKIQVVWEVYDPDDPYADSGLAW